MTEKKKEVKKPQRGRPKTEQVTSKIEEVTVEKSTEAPLPEKVFKPKKDRGTFPVTVNGSSRMMTKFAYNAIKKDPNLEVILPKNSPFFAEDNCEGCN